jgi:hypothetical protein
MQIHRVGSGTQFGETRDYGTTIDPFQSHTDSAPSLASLRKGNITSFERGGGAFTVHGLTRGHLVGMSAQTRESLVNWDDNKATPSFGAN